MDLIDRHVPRIDRGPLGVASGLAVIGTGAHPGTMRRAERTP